jgi:signal transduction histidine kinase
VIVTLVLSIAALAAAARGDVQPGVEVDATGRFVTGVAPAGYAWTAQIRPGQAVVRLTSSEDGWELTTIVAGEPTTIGHAVAERRLRASWPIAVAGLVACVIGVAMLRLGTRLSALALVGAMQLAATPLGLLGEPALSTAALGLSAFLPVAWVAGRRSTGRAVSVVVVVVAAALFLGAWAVARLLPVVTLYESLEPIRSSIESGGLVAVAIGVVVLPLLRREFPALSPREIADFTGLAILGGVSIAVVVVLNVEPIAMAIMAVAVVAIFPRWQRVVTVVADRLLLSDLREQAAIEATEEERARLARDIHDVPLQQIAGVIRRLESAPELHDAGDDLRAVADQLRAVATDLRPPVLDDLGLGAALSFLADRATTEETRVDARFEDATGVSADERAPAGVELAVFRIAEEAVNNATLHADATEIAIEGELAPTRLLLRIRDNGVGLSQPAMAAAAGRGRLGLASMRRRAALIGAELELSSSGGAIVEIRWPR